MVRARGRVVRHLHQIEVPTMTVSSWLKVAMKTHILHSDNLSNIEWRRATFKECLLQGKGWVCLRINLSGCPGRGCPSRSHSEGLTSHPSYGRTGRRRSGPAASIEQKVSRQTSAKDHDGCISHPTCWHQNFWGQKLRFLSFAGEDRKSPTLGAGSPCSSPNISVGPPQSPPTNPYTNLFNSSLYQQYLGQLLANGGGPQAPLNPMLLQVSTLHQSYRSRMLHMSILFDNKKLWSRSNDWF